ncbi:WD40 repeat-containing protein, putative, partial [Bodo saltans]
MITDALTPFRAIGNVCGDVPVSYTLMYGEPVLMIATGRTFLLYRGKELSLLRGGPSFESEVASVAQTGRFRFVAEGPRVHAFSHHKRLWTLPHSPELSTTPAKLLLARDDVVFSYGSDHRIVVRHIRSGDVLSAFPIDASETVTCMELLEGYNNKLLVATSAGNLQLFNFRTGELLVKTTPPGPVSTSSSSSKVLCIASSNYKNIVAVGMSCGALTVFNIATMDEICTLRHENVAVTSLVFRTDKDGFIVSGTSAGEIAVWDLENRCLDGVLTRSKQVASRLEAFETPHTEAVHSLLAFPKGAMIVSASGDNAIMQFRFDTVDGLGLLVRERRGHMGECTAVKFYNSDLLVTAGSDQALRTTHVFSDRASWELSQGKLGRRGRDRMVGREQLKLSPATVLDTSTSRNYQWGSLVSLHDSSALTCSWRMDTRALDTKLSGITTGMHVARCVRMSGCGNFAVVGYSSGNVSLLNLQNKSIRQLFRTPEEKIAHEKSVEAVEVAGGNTVIVSGGLDGKLMLWSLQTTKHLETFDIRRPVRHSCLHEPSNLFICAQDQSICVYPCAARVEGGEVPTSSSSTRLEPVRIFSGHNAAITALALTPDSLKHIVSASADSVIMISDLAAGVCVGLYRTASPVTSLSFHPDALFLATTHLGERGSFLWTNNLRYGFVPDVVENPLAKDVANLPLLHYPNLPLLHYPVARDERPDEEPSTDGKKDTSGSGATAGSNIVDLFDATTDVALLRKKADFEEKKLLNEIQCLGVQRSGLSRNVWYNVTVIDQLKEKNQPLLPPKKRDVPFFLPTTSELRPTFIVQQQQNNKSAASGDSAASRFLKTIGSFTAVQQLILKDQHDDAMDLFKNGMSAQDIDLELRTLVDFSDEAEYIDEEKEQIRMCLLKLLQFLEHHVASGKNADLTQ